MLRTVDPDLLMLRGEQHLGPVGDNPANPQDPNAMVNQSAIEADPMAAQDMQQPVQGAPGGNASAAPSSPLPAPATPPEPFGALPTDPSKVPLK